MENDLLLLLIGTSAMVALIGAIIYFTFLYQKKISDKQNELFSIQSLLQSEELKSAYALLEGKDNERQRIASDLHDTMGGQLSTIKIYLNLLELTELSEKQLQLIQKLQNLIDLTIEDVRIIAHNLSNSTLDKYGFKKTMEQLIEVVTESKKLKIACNIVLMDDLPPVVAREMYQVIQELLTNTLRHSSATNVNIDINYVKQELTIIFEDNGQGFDLAKINKGLGLKSIQLRVDRHNGHLTIDSQPNRGVAFIVEINIPHENY